MKRTAAKDKGELFLSEHRFYSGRRNQILTALHFFSKQAGPRISQLNFETVMGAQKASFKQDLDLAELSFSPPRCTLTKKPMGAFVFFSSPAVKCHQSAILPNSTGQHTEMQPMDWVTIEAQPDLPHIGKIRSQTFFPCRCSANLQLGVMYFLPHAHESAKRNADVARSILHGKVKRRKNFLAQIRTKWK